MIHGNQERVTQILEKTDRRGHSIESLSLAQLAVLCKIIESELREEDKYKDHAFYSLSVSDLATLTQKIRGIGGEIRAGKLTDVAAQNKLADAVAMSSLLEAFLYGTENPMHKAIRQEQEQEPTITQEGDNIAVFMPGTCTMEDLHRLFPGNFIAAENIFVKIGGDYVGGDKVSGATYVDGQKVNPISGPGFTSLLVRVTTTNGQQRAELSWTDASGRRQTRTITK